MAFATTGGAEMQDSLWRQVTSCWSDMTSAAEGLPEYSEETESAYLAQMMSGERLTRLSSSVDKLQAAVHHYLEVSEKLDVVANGEVAQAKAAAKHELTKVCMVTCVRILLSKSAKLLCPSLHQPVTATLDFASTHELQMPSCISERLQALLKSLADASAPKRRRASQ